jgi:hypothetical protein
MIKEYDIFISYSQHDGEIAASLLSQLDQAGFRCFMADRSILAAAQWEPELRSALLTSHSVLLLITPRSKDSLWVAAEAGAAWVLEKRLVPVLLFVEPTDMFEPIRRFQARKAETPEQVTRLIAELGETRRSVAIDPAPKQTTGSQETNSEIFTSPRDWPALLKIGEWSYDDQRQFIVGEGMHRYLLSQHIYGDTAFSINCRLTFLALRPQSTVNAVNAGVLLGWRTPDNKVRYHNILLTGERLLLERVGARGGTEFRDWQHVDEGIPFKLTTGEPVELEIHASSDVITIHHAGKELHAWSLGEALPMGRVGLRPWRSRMQCDQFDVVADGSYPPLPSL